ncbi:MAG: hypothetical protein OIN84_05750 [Candidatus Methanoperedens sp.]|nr:hypothetical protein [Candidatus Methanoperedens sp. BLZ2]KAB2947699.1 MAG: hypothetical protein F9K14_02485 [Candidatus Methanoperedens sp.]MBZ0176240.1 hypothetical protein [Candidatus Methanoperedens nitroreducens]MCX9077465.1 hypothetical protein [Candidatus Methanoperedens sp.]
MKRIYIIIIMAAVVAVFFLYLSDSRKSIFTERLGDMTLTRYETGEVAAQQISNMYGLKDIPLAKGYFAVYSGKKGIMRIWVAEATDHSAANDAFSAMNSMLGGSTGHEGHEYSGDVGQIDSHKGHGDAGTMNGTIPVKLDIMEFVKPDVYMMRTNNEYNYYYFKMDYKMGRVFWIIFDSADTGYQLSIVKQAVVDI